MVMGGLTAAALLSETAPAVTAVGGFFEVAELRAAALAFRRTRILNGISFAGIAGLVHKYCNDWATE